MDELTDYPQPKNSVAGIAEKLTLKEYNKLISQGNPDVENPPPLVSKVSN